jgi:hypothetical protein
MSWNKIELTLLIGPEVPLPAPIDLMEALTSVEISEKTEGHSGFELVFNADRSGLDGLLDYPLMSNPLFKTFNRVTLIATVAATPYVLINGFITHQQVVPKTGESGTIVISGGDVSMMMNRDENIVYYPELADPEIVEEICLRYAEYGLDCEVIPPSTLNQPIPEGRVPTQRCTDWKFIKYLAKRYGYQFYITPGLVPDTNKGYWGPPKFAGDPKPALTTNMGTFNNIESINFTNNALTPTTVGGEIMDPDEDDPAPIETEAADLPPMAAEPTSDENLLYTRKILPRYSQGEGVIEAETQAQGKTNSSSAKAVTVSGVIDTLVYSDVLHIGDIVGMRGVGWSFDGLYRIHSVNHSLKRGAYKQHFELTRDGLGSLTPVVAV